MMRAADFRARAREALRGHWGVAIAVALVASLLGGGLDITYNTAANTGAESTGISSFLSHDVMIWVTTLSVALLLLALFIGGVMSIGWADFNLKLLDRQNVRFGNLFDHFYRIGAGICLVLLQNLFIFLWSLLFIIPGFIAAYRYAMMPYLMAEFPELGALDAMRESKRLMAGNKWRLFCLDLSFLGWALVSALTLGIGSLWLNPYTAAARAAFYQEICREDQARRNAENQWRGPEY